MTNIQTSDIYSVIPDRVREILQKDHPGEEVKLSLSSDITGHRHYGVEWLVVTNKTVLVYCIGEKGDSAPCHDISLISLKKARISPLVGIMSLLVEPKVGSPFKIISFSQVLNPFFAHAAEDISRLINNEPILDKSTLSGKICVSCKKPIPEELNKCPRCTDRKGTLLRISQFARVYKGTLVLILLTMLAGTVCGLIPPYMNKIFVDVIFKPDAAGVYTNMEWLGITCIVLFAAYAMQLFLGGIQERLSGTLGFKTVADVRQRVYEKLQELSLGFFDKHQTGALLARVNQDTSEMQRLLVDFVPITIESILMFIGIGIFLFFLSWQLTLFVLIPIFCIVLFVKMVIPKFWIFFHRFFHRRSKLSAIVADSLSGIRVVKAFGQEQMETDKFQKYSLRYRDAGIELVKRWSIFHPVFHLLLMSGMVIVWYVGGHLLFAGKMSLGSVLAYSGYLMMFYRPVFMLTRMLDLITNALSASERVFDVLDTEPMIKESPDAVGLPNLRGEIEFRNVTFGYDKFKPVLKNVSLTIHEHEMIGLVGKSGAGKSTMINVICRLYDTTGGEILLDGVDLRKIKQNDLRKNIGIVLQDTFLFNGTIYENICYTKPGATREEVIKASIAANAHEFILKKPDGYDTEVGERGNSLSGGEKQRISIARAILRDPKILILDEATSSVDTQTEKKIQEALERLTKGRTTIAIAHRLSTLRKCDRLVVLKNGEIGEIGTHQELLAKKGIFYELVQIQSELAQIMAFETPQVEGNGNGKKPKNFGDKGGQDNGEGSIPEQI